MNDQYIIDVKNLNKSFGTNHVVKNVDLQVKRGEIFGFLGPNGSGKTTTIRMLCGLLKPDSGSGQCLGYDILTQSLTIKLHVGYMTQRYSFYEDLTIYENLDFIARVYQIPDRKKRIAEIIERFDFKDRIKQLTGELSGGWKQRVALAACLLHKPDLLLLDEPTAGVDPKARRDFWEELHRLSLEGITTLVSTHYMDEAARCTRLAYILHGTILIQGKISDVIASVGLVTWEVKGKHLAELASELKKIPSIEQVIIFGDALHISSKNAEQLEKAIAPFQNRTDLQWRMVNTNLEDVFINLSEKI